MEALVASGMSFLITSIAYCHALTNGVVGVPQSRSSYARPNPCGDGIVLGDVHHLSGDFHAVAVLDQSAAATPEEAEGGLIPNEHMDVQQLCRAF